LGGAGEKVNRNLAWWTARRIELVVDAAPVVRFRTVTELAGKR
jgi:hypothetical protein